LGAIGLGCNPAYNVPSEGLEALESEEDDSLFSGWDLDVFRELIVAAVSLKRRNFLERS
jgi:hypothetical protein